MCDIDVNLNGVVRRTSTDRFSFVASFPQRNLYSCESKDNEFMQNMMKMDANDIFKSSSSPYHSLFNL